MTDCVFCKIINKEFPSLTIYEDDEVMCIIPKRMEVYGHLLVLPKKHSEDIFSISNEELSHISLIFKKIALLLQKKLHATGINILHASGKDAGQSIGPLHFHIFPRFSNDGINAWPILPKNVFDKEDVFRKITRD